MAQTGWSKREIDITIQAYFALFEADLAGQKPNKNQAYKAVADRLSTRSWKAVSRKFQNISAVLVDLHLGYLKGLQPNAHYQRLLLDRVVDFLLANDVVVYSEDELAPPVETPLPANWNSVVTPPPPPIARPIWQVRTFQPFHIDFFEKQKQNSRLGEAGERFVLEFEKQRLMARKQDDLVREVEWSSKERGDGLGYDVRSFDESGEEHFIEVKTTNSGIYKRFMISENEVCHSELYPRQSSLYRVYDFTNDPHLYQVSGDLRKVLDLQPRNYWGFVI